MTTLFPLSSAAAAVLMLVALSSCSSQNDVASKPAAKPAVAPAAKAPEAAAPAAKAEAPAKAKATKLAGDIGLLDMEKNYLILVTKEGKLVTLDFDQKTKVTQVTPTPGKIADVGLGSTATVTYQQDKGKNVATGLEYRPAKGE
jgi:hypothetical protein